MTEVNIMRLIVLLTVLIYIVFYLIDRRRIMDEREKLIELKAVDFQQKGTLWGLMLVVAAYTYHPAIDAIYPIMIFALFFTKQITLFPDDAVIKDDIRPLPDYWRVTILCIIAGAFSERIYKAIGSMLDKYIDKPGEGKT